MSIGFVRWSRWVNLWASAERQTRLIFVIVLALAILVCLNIMALLLTKAGGQRMLNLGAHRDSEKVSRALIHGEDQSGCRLGFSPMLSRCTTLYSTIAASWGSCAVCSKS